MIEALICGSILVCLMMIIRAIIFGKIEKKYLVCFWMIVCARFLLMAGGPLDIKLPGEVMSLFEEQGTLSPEDTYIHEIKNRGDDRDEKNSIHSADNISNEYESTVNKEAQNIKPGEDAAKADSFIKPDIVRALRIVYYFGAICLAMFFVGMYIRQDIKNRRLIPVTEENVIRYVKGFGVKRRISLLWIDKPLSPYTYGLFRPKIVLPMSIMDIGDEGLKYVVVHEMIHIKKWDFLKKLFLNLVLILYWFNPLVWVMYIVANRDIEYDCDERVVRRLGGECRREYASMVLKMMDKRNSFLGCGNSFSGCREEERMKVIMKSEKRKHFKIHCVMAVVALMVAVGFLFSFVPKATKAEDVGNSAQNNDSGEKVIIKEIESETSTEMAEKEASILQDKNRLCGELWKYYLSRYNGVGDIKVDDNTLFTASENVDIDNQMRKEGLIRLQDAADVLYYSVSCSIEDFEMEPSDNGVNVTLSECVSVAYIDRGVSDSFAFKVKHDIVLNEELEIVSDIYNENTISGFDNTQR